MYINPRLPKEHKENNIVAIVAMKALSAHMTSAGQPR
jgi:hypothetical protein